MYKWALLFILLVGFGFIAQAQDEIQVDDTITVQVAENTLRLKFKEFPYQNTDGFQQYRPLERNGLPLARMGNLGLGLHSYQLNFQDWSTTSLMGAYQPYLFQKESLNFYKMSRPFTQLSYANGVKAEQLFSIFHSQNLGEGLNISFEYQRMTSEGYFVRQLTNHTQFNATYTLESRNKRFYSKGYFLINDIEAQENGGITAGQTDNPDEAVLQPNKLNRGQNQSRSQGVGTKNEYVIITDSTKSLLSISHDFDFTKAYRNYADDTTLTPNFYDNFLLDKNRTADSSFSHTFSNAFALHLADTSLSVGFRNEQLHFYQNSFLNRTLASNYITAAISGQLYNQTVSVNFEKGISGFHQKELDWSTKVDFQTWRGIKAKLILHQTKKVVDYLIANERSNHFSFRNNFSTSNFNEVKAVGEYEKYKTKIEIGFQEYSDYIYFDTLQQARQFSESITNFYAKLHKDFKFGSHWNLKNTLLYQSISNEKIIPLPAISSYHSFYYESFFFNKALLFQIGADVYYIGKYGGYNYSPALAQFYLNEPNAALGETLQLDLFLTMRVNKSFRIFLKMENITSSDFDEASYRIQDYPIPGRALKIGLSWRMVN